MFATLIFSQNLLAGGSQDDEDDEDDEDDGMYTDEADLRRKLSRLAGPGGALESESRKAPHLMAPGGVAETLAGHPEGEELIEEARKGVIDLSPVFGDVDVLSGRKRAVLPGGKGQRGTPHDGGESEDDGGSGDIEDEDWGTFDDDDLGEGESGSLVNVGEGGRGESGQDVPGMLGGERFVGVEWGGAEARSRGEENGAEEEASTDSSTPPSASR